MRKGYRREYDSDGDKELLFDPKGEAIAGIKFEGSQQYATIKSYYLDTKTKEVKDRDELRQLLAHLADKHYMKKTTSLQRCKDYVGRFVSYPVWAWLAFLIAAAALVAQLFA